MRTATESATERNAAEKDDHYDAMCPCRGVLDLLANKWTALVIEALEERPHRFGELRRRLKGISQKVLTQTLRSLEVDGLVSRTVYPVAPVRVDYALTELGRSAARPLAALQRWSAEHSEQIDRARRDYAERMRSAAQ